MTDPAGLRRAIRGPGPPIPPEDLARSRAFREALARRPEPVENIGYVDGPDGEPVEILYRKAGAEIVRIVTVGPADGAVLYRLVRAVRPRTILELGSGVGGSAAAMLAALRANGAGSLVTVEGAPDRAALTEEHLARFGSGGWRVVLSRTPDFLPRIPDEVPEIDFAFVDAEHLEGAVLAQADAIAARMPDGGVIVFDDLPWRGVGAAWRAIVARPDCAWAAEPRRRGLRRFGVWLKGPGRAAGWDGVPERIETTRPYALAPLWRIARAARDVFPEGGPPRPPTPGR